MWAQRAARARYLAERYPATSEILLFYASLAEWQGEVAGREQVEELWPSLQQFVLRTGPPALREAARSLDPAAWLDLVQKFWDAGETSSPVDFFARAALQPYAAARRSSMPSAPEGVVNQCPWCARPPQAGCLRREGEGAALELVCSLCFGRWSFPRSRCPACGEAGEGRLVHYSAPEFPHLRVQACEACRSYLHLVDLEREPQAIPEVDELAALPLDLWACEQGYHKLHPNLAGV